MKDKVTLSDKSEIMYVTQLIENDIKGIEMTLASKQKFLRKFKGKQN